MTQPTPKPLPCPFCGAENVKIAEGSTYRWAHAECAVCGASAGGSRRQYGQGTDDPEVQQAAITEWNVRDTREIDALRADLSAWRTMFPVNTPAEIAAKLMRGG